MKRLFSKLLPAVLGMALLSSTTAFAQTSAEAKAVYDEVTAKSQTMSDGNIYMHMNMMMSDGTDTIHMVMDMNTLYKNMNQPEQLQFMSQNIMSMDDKTMESVSWYSDGYSFTESNGQKLKVKMNMTDAMKTAASSASTLNTSTDFFSDLSLQTVGDQRILSYTMDDQKTNEYIKQVFSQMGLDSILASVTFNVRDVKGDYTLTPDNFYSHANISMYMDMTMEGETVSVAINGEMAMLNPGQPVELLLPNPAEYTEIVPGQTAA